MPDELELPGVKFPVELLPEVPGRLKLDVPVIPGALVFGCGLDSCKVQRFPLIPDDEDQLKLGIKRIDRIAEPLILACPQSVSTVTNFTSVAPVSNRR